MKRYKRKDTPVNGINHSGSIQHPVFELHIERKLRSKYQVEDSLFSQKGNIIFTDFNAVRRFVHQLNAKRDPRLQVYPGEVYASGLLQEIYHYIFRMYEKEANPIVFDKAEAHLKTVMGQERMLSVLLDFLDKFPTSMIFKGEVSAARYLSGSTREKPHVHIVIEEAIMLFFANINPAHKRLKELFDLQHLSHPDDFNLLISTLEKFFKEQPPFGPDQMDIFALFKAPIAHAPDDISRQIDFVLSKWQTLLPDTIRTQLLRGKDLLKEDVRLEPGEGTGIPTMAPRYKGGGGDAAGLTIGKSGYRFADDVEKDYEETEAFTPDVHWMPSVVMLAKNTYVWLDQLSRKYQREIKTLDQIPDEELDLLRRWNFNALWLIGIWERSVASKRIKHIMGNLDAVSSAYSLYDYHIAADLGGEAAYDNLNQRTRERGIRLASDMVPNHTGVYSKWTTEHPDYFIQTNQPPFPGYTFSGENLSHHPDIDIRLEDGYFSKTDAAVVFQWRNNKSGDTRYIYHGNDGTNMPWNDTAQLDMLKHEVRQAVIEKIFEVARKFSIIRFDAAMTLAKKHFSRLWYPRPGTGGDIPSRADYAMSQKEFDTLFPVEFWREVVDRMNAEMPETLLLAEAFWFMEGYFVRTLGMHRVYNSAFMHMLKNEENEKYRDLITNTLEFEPEILKRYVNFMSNPDEETAIRQFGTDDKYFGVALMMTTLPGLPMFAHGQIEGYTEKYGMEYQRAYYNEVPEQWLVEKHEKQLFPVIRRRYLFSEVDNFNIFDFIDGYGNINENVFAYTNCFHDERALILYNNKYDQAQGRIHFSAPKLTRVAQGKESISISLGQALAVSDEADVFYAFRDHISGLQYLRRGRDFHHDGLQWRLNGFQYHLLWDFTEIRDSSGEYEKLLWKTSQGVPSIEMALHEMRLQPLHDLFEALFSEDILNFLINRIMDEAQVSSEKLGYMLLKGRYEFFIKKVIEFLKLDNVSSDVVTADFIKKVKAIESLFVFVADFRNKLKEIPGKQSLAAFDEHLTIGSTSGYRENMILLLGQFAMEALNENVTTRDAEQLETQLKLQWPLYNVLKRTGKGEHAIEHDIDLIRILSHKKVNLFISPSDTSFSSDSSENKSFLKTKAQQADALLKEDLVRRLIGINEHQNIVYFSKENYEELLDWMFTISVLDCFLAGENNDNDVINDMLNRNISLLFKAREMSEQSGYQLEKLKTLLNKESN